MYLLKMFSLFPLKYFQMETNTLCATRSTEVVGRKKECFQYAMNNFKLLRKFHLSSVSHTSQCM